jgi:hypothetical protein
MPWTEQLIHFIDFEGSVASGILEYGVVTMRGAQIIETRTRLCRATGRVRAEDVAVHKLDAATVASYAPFTDEFDRFAVWRIGDGVGALDRYGPAVSATLPDAHLGEIGRRGGGVRFAGATGGGGGGALSAGPAVLSRGALRCAGRGVVAGAVGGGAGGGRTAACLVIGNEHAGRNPTR